MRLLHVNQTEEDSRSIANIRNAYQVALGFLKREFAEDQVKLRAYYGYLTNKVKMIRIQTEDVGKALKIFETINDRGVGLDAMDLLKNLLFMKAALMFDPPVASREVLTARARAAEVGTWSPSDQIVLLSFRSRLLSERGNGFRCGHQQQQARLESQREIWCSAFPQIDRFCGRRSVDLWPAAVVFDCRAFFSSSGTDIKPYRFEIVKPAIRKNDRENRIRATNRRRVSRSEALFLLSTLAQESRSSWVII